MDNYCIIRLEKIKSWRELQARSRHNNRTSKERPTDDFDETKTCFNEKLNEQNISNPAAIKKAYERVMNNLSRKPRPDAVKAVEIVVTFSNPVQDRLTPEQQKSYFEESVKHLKDKFGEDNFFGGWIHHDEKTKHAHLYFIPVDKNRVLNFKSFMHGKNAFSDFQTDFHKEVGSKFGLDRGIIREEKKKHQSVKAYKRALLDKEVEVKDVKLSELDDARAGLEALRLANAMQDERLQAREAALEARAEELEALSLALQGKEASNEALRAFFEARSVEMGRQYKAKLNELGEELAIVNQARDLFDDFRIHMDLHFNGNIEDSNRFYANAQNDEWLKMCDPTQEEPKQRVKEQALKARHEGEAFGTDVQSFGR